MAYELQDNQITVFNNTKKTEDKQPDLTGEVKINGEVLRVALWKKQGNNGEFFSGKISPKNS